MKKGFEEAASAVVEAFVRKLFEINERARQRDLELMQIHENAVREVEKDLLEKYENQRFSVKGEQGVFDIKNVENEKVTLQSEEKSVSVPLDKLDSSIEPRENEYLETFKDKTIDEMNYIIDQKIKGRDYFAKSISEIDNPEQREQKYTELESWNKTIERMNEAKEILENRENKISNEQENISDLKVMKSAAGYYIGREVTENGFSSPYDRQSDYFQTEKGVQYALDQINNQSKTITQVNHEISGELEKNISNQSSLEVIPSQVRAQFEVLDHLKNMSERDVLNALKTAQKQAKNEGRPVAEVYKENLQNEIGQSIRIFKEKTLDIAINTHETYKDLRHELREVENKINANLGVLYQAKLERKVYPDQYNQLKENLEHQKGAIENRLEKINLHEQKINEQLKADLKQQFPDLKTEKLPLNETIGLSKAAYTMTNEKTIENLKNFSLDNNLRSVINSIDKATKAIEIEITETTEIAFSR